MAGDWIKMRLDLQTHPKIVRILSATKADKFRVIGGLHAVWSVFDTHSADGRLDGYTAETLDHIIGWTGFAAAMISVGWLIADGDVALLLPEYDEHNGKSGKRRAEDQKRKREDRKSPEPVRKMSAKDSDEKRTREEKRREDIENLKSMSDPDGPDAPPESVAGNQEEEVVERRKKRRASPEDMKAVLWMFDLVKKVNPSAKAPNFDTWADEVRLIREIDERSHHEICELFAWAKKDSFWAPNIQSPSKLREKWDQLTELRTRPARGNNGRPSLNSIGVAPGADDDIFNEMRRTLP